MSTQSNTPHENPLYARPATQKVTSEAFIGESDEMHQAALAEIKLRGEDPKKILRAFDLMNQKLREQYLQAEHAGKTTAIDDAEDRSSWTISSATYFEESVAAGIPTPSQTIEGRPAEIADFMQGINPAGKLVMKVSGTSMTGTSIEHGDTVLVDPKAEIRDGDLVLANLAGHGQVVKRLRITANGEAFLESENPDFKPIRVSESGDLRIHGKVVWRCGPLR